MNPSRFDAIVKNRAQERVTIKINAFRQTVLEAIRTLGLKQSHQGDNGYAPGQLVACADLRLVLENVGKGLEYEPDSGVNPTREWTKVKWPRFLWVNEQAAVEAELLSTMDEMSKALCAKPPSEDSPQPVADPQPPAKKE